MNSPPSWEILPCLPIKVACWSAFWGLLAGALVAFSTSTYPGALYRSHKEAPRQVWPLLLPIRSRGKSLYGHSKGVIQLSGRVSEYRTGETCHLYGSVKQFLRRYVQKHMPAYVEMRAHSPQPMTTILILDVSRTLCARSVNWLTYAWQTLNCGVVLHRGGNPSPGKPKLCGL